jgi:hypothetical protein
MAPTCAISPERSPSPASAHDSFPTPTIAAGLVQALVLWLIDGDAIEVGIEGESYRVRCIGIDLAPS